MSLDQFLYSACGAGFILCLLSLMLLRRRPLAGLIALIITVSATVGIALLSRDVLSYRRLGDEELVAKVFIGQRDKQRYVVSVDQRNEDALQSFMIAGDEWQLDSRVLKWDKELARIGFDNLFRLERISGRYQDINAETSAVRTAYLVNSSAPVDVWHWVREIDFLWQWVAADYGSAVYAPMIDGAQYSVYMTYSGLSIRPDNPIAQAALRQWSP
ncbi:cation/multidrug efflux pump [Spongiibacter taiwanensis]|uniref:cation/multidrug efflux pump n=1 Tax=Spongiibacter taiwanensis TaxID=1748242 RepID=UPI0020350939|nr:cation/multidrug efflux pump [Spongiibacter taiwanensis]USA43432.1 cation/multidrug efflux pump [Spongiibacter taiwanensis]